MKPIALLAALGGLVLSVPTSAQHCHQPAPVAPLAVASAHVSPVLALPLYGAAYTGGAGYGEQNEALRLILEELRALRADIAALKDGGPVGSLPLRKAADPYKVMQAHCAACHTSGIADTKGGGFELFNDKGQPLKLSRPDREVITKRVSAGTMPPATKPKLSAEDKDALLSALKDTPKTGPAPKEVPAKK